MPPNGRVTLITYVSIFLLLLYSFLPSYKKIKKKGGLKGKLWKSYVTIVTCRPYADVVELRIDGRAKIGGVTRTPQGGLECPAYLTRTGVLTYYRADGTTQRELRHPDEVFREDHMKTFAGAPVTIGHHGLVTPQNWRQVSVGHVKDEVKADGAYIASRVIIQDAEAVAGVESGEYVELSCGYTCDVEHVPGDYNGEHYDAVQRNIRGNHVALLPAGGGRAGSEVKLRMDGVNVCYAEGMAELDVAALSKENERLKGELEATKTRLDSASKLDIDALVTDRLNLVQDAREILGADFKVDGKKDLEIMKEACEKACPQVKLDGKSEDYLRGMFNSEVKQAKQGKANVATGALKLDALDPISDKIAAARKRNEERSVNEWKVK